MITLHTVETILYYTPYVIAVASAFANILPHPEKAEGFLSKVSTFVNVLALNLKHIKGVK